jgi:hypothetical protein
MLIPMTFFGDALSQTYRQMIMATSGLRGYWRLGESSGTTAEDETATYDGTYGGTYTQGSTGLINGDADTCLSLGGAGYVSVSSFQVDSEMSIEFWYLSNDNATALFVNAQPTNSIFNILIESGTFQVRVNSVGATVSITPPTVSVKHHIVATISSTGYVKLYVDGSLAADADGNDLSGVTGARDLDFGRYGDFGGGYYFNGKLDEIAIYNVVLDASTVLAHYNKGA